MRVCPLLALADNSELALESAFRGKADIRLLPITVFIGSLTERVGQ